MFSAWYEYSITQRTKKIEINITLIYPEIILNGFPCFQILEQGLYSVDESYMFQQLFNKETLYIVCTSSCAMIEYFAAGSVEEFCKFWERLLWII